MAALEEHVLLLPLLQPPSPFLAVVVNDRLDHHVVVDAPNLERPRPLEAGDYYAGDHHHLHSRVFVFSALVVVVVVAAATVAAAAFAFAFAVTTTARSSTIRSSLSFHCSLSALVLPPSRRCPLPGFAVVLVVIVLPECGAYSNIVAIIVVAMMKP